MSSNPLKNIPLKTFKDFLEWEGLKHVKTRGDHEKWVKADLTRPAIIQAGKDPVPEFIVKNILRTINSSKERYIEFLKS